jgi:hypothetical protein
MTDKIDATVNTRLSTAIPAGMIIWTNGEHITGVHLPGSGEVIPPKHFTTADPGNRSHE